ncbi:MAG: N-acetyltransferase family protein, partial [Pseudomonadota bacterium]
GGLARIAQHNGRLAGWAGVSPTSTRAVYRGVGEISIYIADGYQGHGIGRALMNDVIVASESQGFWTLVAQIFPENDASLALHRQAGFRIVGTRHKLGQMTYGPCAGQWRDVVFLERRSDTPSSSSFDQ